MGGSLGEGNTTAAAEFNIWADPEAAGIVFRSGIPIRMAGLDVTHQALVLPADVARLEGLGNAGRAGLRGPHAVLRHPPSRSLRLGWPAGPRCRRGRVAGRTRPGGSRRLRVDVEVGDGLTTRGRTVADAEGLAGRPPNAEVGRGDRS